MQKREYRKFCRIRRRNLNSQESCTWASGFPCGFPAGCVVLRPERALSRPNSRCCGSRLRFPKEPCAIPKGAVVAQHISLKSQARKTELSRGVFKRGARAEAGRADLVQVGTLAVVGVDVVAVGEGVREEEAEAWHTCWTSVRGGRGKGVQKRVRNAPGHSRRGCVRLEPCVCMVLWLVNSACVAGVHTPAKPVYGRHVAGTVVL